MDWLIEISSHCFFNAIATIVRSVSEAKTGLSGTDTEVVVVVVVVVGASETNATGDVGATTATCTLCSVTTLVEGRK